MTELHLPFLRSYEPTFSELNSYLRLAYLAISIAARPLHSSEILSISEKFGLMPDHLFGNTQIRTLNARLAEDILEKGDDSLFFRTAPAVYYLRHLSPLDDPNRAYELYNAVRREKKITKEDVLVAPKDLLQEYIFGQFIDVSEEKFSKIFSTICYFKNRYQAEEDIAVKQFVSYTTVRHDDKFLVFRRGKFSNKSENLRNTLSIAVGGHVTPNDFSLFNTVYEALLENSSRELMEELQTDDVFTTTADVKAVSTVKGFINVDDNSDAKQHIAAVVSVSYPNETPPKGKELGITDVSWYTKSELAQYQEYFDLWSRFIVQRILNEEYE